MYHDTLFSKAYPAFLKHKNKFLLTLINPRKRTNFVSRERGNSFQARFDSSNSNREKKKMMTNEEEFDWGPLPEVLPPKSDEECGGLGFGNADGCTAVPNAWKLKEINVCSQEGN